MDIADLKTILYAHIDDIGTTPNINKYIATSKGGDVRATARAWEALSEAERAIVLEAYNRLRLQVPA